VAQAQFANLPDEAGVDVLVAMSPENFGYVSGANILTVRMIPPRQAFAVIPKRGAPQIIVCSIETAHAVEESWIEALTTYTEFKDEPVDVLARVLRDALGFDKGRLGIDLNWLPQRSFQRLQAQLPDVVFTDTSEVVARRRAIKTADEIAALRRVTEVTHRAVLDAMAASRIGDTELTMALRISNGMLANGADTVPFMCFGSGDATLPFHAPPGDRKVGPSEIIRFDLGGGFGRWWSDFARTYSTGDPTSEQKKTYRGLREIQEITIASARAGVKAEDVFRTCADAFKVRGLPFTMPHVGHSFGLELHESPMLRPGETTVLRPGMVLNIEPSTLDATGAAYHLEDLVVVTEGDPIFLSLGLAPMDIPVIGQRAAS